jgi:UDP-N-acetylmuramate--alanine ligase
MKSHLVGIGGVGMSALAVAMLRTGHEVTGSDRDLTSPNVKMLNAFGIKVFPDDGSGVDCSLDEIVVSTAIEETNLDLVKAKKLSIKTIHRASALDRTLSKKKLVAVAGTCGKTTVTALLGHILSEGGLDPFCVNGANVPGWEGAVRFGEGDFAVAEVDESDKSLTSFNPYAAIITNASADHYSKEEMDEVFDRFIQGLPGPLVDGRTSAGLDRDEETSLQIKKTLKMPGAHNIENALAAVSMAVHLGVDKMKAISSLATFRGVNRRLERYGERVYDDYAHNPEKIKAMWTALAEMYPQGVCVIWRPHGYGPIKKMMDQLAAMFNETIRSQDKLLLLPVYDAGGTADRSVSSEMLAEKIYEGKCVLVENHDEAFQYCSSHAEQYGAFVTSGARDVKLPALALRISGSV